MREADRSRLSASRDGNGQSDRASASDEVHDDRDHRDDDQEMDEPARDVEGEESERPADQKNDSDG